MSLSESTVEGNLTEQENEKDLLSAMFESDILSIEDTVITVVIQTLHHTLVLRTLYHEQYPSDSAPILAIIDPNNQCAVKLSETEDHCEAMFVKGECVLYTWILHLQDTLEGLDKTIEERIASEDQKIGEEDEGEDLGDLELAEALQDIQLEEAFSMDELIKDFTYTPSTPSDESYDIYTGEVLLERKSYFQAHVCRVHSRADVSGVLAMLLQNPKIAAASHNILAYRYSDENGKANEDYEDDGETKAGGRLLELLQLMGVQNMLVVVSRWYGGIQLGPSRFKCINNVARDTVVASGLHTAPDPKGGKGKKKKGK